MEQILWAVKAAPVADVYEWATLVAMAEAADQDGCNSMLSVSTISAHTLLSSRKVQDARRSLEARGLIRKGDQTVANRYPADRRPVVYDLQVPHSYFRSEKPSYDGTVDLAVNTWRAGRGRAPLTAEERPELPPPPEKKTRADKGKKRPKRDGATSSHPVAEPDGVTSSHPRGDYKSPRGVTSSHPTLPTNPPYDPQKTRGGRSVVVEPPVTREPATPPTTSKPKTPTPDQILTAAGLTTARDRRAFRSWLRKPKTEGGRGIENPDGLIVTRTPEDLAAHIHAWRVSLDETAEDYQPDLCKHGHDVTAGPHMCPDGCDPDRQRPAPTSADVEPDDGGSVKMPERVRQAREALGSKDWSTFRALVAADETTPGGVTPSILESAGVGAQNGA